MQTTDDDNTLETSAEELAVASVSAGSVEPIPGGIQCGSCAKYFASAMNDGDYDDFDDEYGNPVPTNVWFCNVCWDAHEDEGDPAGEALEIADIAVTAPRGRNLEVAAAKERVFKEREGGFSRNSELRQSTYDDLEFGDGSDDDTRQTKPSPKIQRTSLTFQVIDEDAVPTVGSQQAVLDEGDPEEATEAALIAAAEDALRGMNFLPFSPPQLNGFGHDQSRCSPLVVCFDVRVTVLLLIMRLHAVSLFLRLVADFLDAAQTGPV